MNRKITMMILLSAAAMVDSCREQSEFQVNKVYSGFRLEEKRFVNEANAECLYFIHEKSGARLLKIAAADPNKMFNIAFKTLPENDYGTPHILEHSVLNGSANFPVKSPFDILRKGSLNTFLNAMTSSDFTTYPVASMNEADYFNLMHVYLDAVFNPLMLTDKRIMQQEGWHYELTGKDAPLVYKGVVYNEMKGAYSDPISELYYQTGKNLFPDNVYGFESGGHPNDIPKLTQEYFAAFHRKYYHPSNSYIMLYGDADLNRELRFINDNYLANYEKSDKQVDITNQEPLREMKVVEAVYAAPENSPVKDNTYLSMSWVTNENTDRTTTMAFQVIVNALVNHESGPVRLALQEAGIGRETMAWFTEAKQNVFTIVVQNANPDDRDRFREVVTGAIRKVVAEGFDSIAIQGILNRTEFTLKEGDTPQKGLMYLFKNQQPWMYSGDPFLGLEFDKPLSEIKNCAGNRFLESLVEKYLLNNPHSLLLTLKPEPGLQSVKDKETEKQLQAIKASMSVKQLDSIISETNALIQYQQMEDSPEAVATIPLLKLSDIPAESEFYRIEQEEAGGIPVLWCNQFTNNILYSTLYFDLRTLPLDKIPYVSLLTSILGKLNTAAYSFGELDNQLNLHTGGFYVELNTFLRNRNDDEMIPKLAVTAKATTAKAGKMTGLVSEILLRSVYNDQERLKTVITRLHSNLDADIKQNGLNYARMRTSSYITNSGMFSELSGGLDFYRFLTSLTENFDQKFPAICKNLEETAALLFNRKNMIASVTCSAGDLPIYKTALEKAAGEMPGSDLKLNDWIFTLNKGNEALLSASKVQYVVKGYNLKKLGYKWNGKISVLNQVISTDWLQNQVRVIGGAYGGFSSFNPYGAAYFMSYRDPNLKETLQTYDSTPKFLEKFNADEQTMTRFIIGTIAKIDQPKTPSQKGRTAVQYFFENTTSDLLNRERKEILSTTVADIRNMKPMVEDILKQNIWCVYGNEAKIKENNDLFRELISIEKQK